MHQVASRVTTSIKSFQVLGDKPNEAIDLLETSLLVKKTAFEAQESAPLVPVSVSEARACKFQLATQAGGHGHSQLQAWGHGGRNRHLTCHTCNCCAGLSRCR